MELRKLGNSGIEVSPITIGCWPFGSADGSYWGAQQQADVDKVVHASLDCGINFFDNAEIYNAGESEKSLAAALGDRRKEAVILSKFNPGNNFVKGEGFEERFDARLNDMLGRLNTDYLDVLMIHWPNPDAELIEALIRSFERGVESGKVRAIGISNFGPKQMTQLKELGLNKYVCVNELQYNIVSRAIEDEIIPMCQADGYGVMSYCTLQQGVLSGKYTAADQIPAGPAHSRHFLPERGQGTSRHTEAGAEAEIFELLAKMKGMSADLGYTVAELSLAWALAKEGITTAIAGCRNLDQLAMNRSAADIKLSDETMKTLNEWSQPAYDKLGNSADYFLNREASRIY